MGVFPFGGVEVMLLGALVAAVVCAVGAVLVRRRTGWSWAISLWLLVWSVVVIGLVTLIPANGAPGIVPVEGRLEECSWDIGGPAPDGFWIFSGGQRLLNTVIFVPSGALLVMVVARWPRAAIVLAPLGLAALVGYSVGIEFTQLALARIDRACDVTDMIDNATGAAVGTLLGVPLAFVLRPWKRSTVER